MDMKTTVKIKRFFDDQMCREAPGPKFLGETPLCDFSSEDVRDIAKQKEKEKETDRERIRATYHFIRQNIKYGFDAWTRKASQTLVRGYGMCFNKTNLMVAILREMKIPSLYSVIWIRREAFLHTVGERMLEKVQPETVHIYGEAYDKENNEWVVLLDTSVDFKLRKSLDKLGHDPNRHIITNKPIERFAQAEEIIEFRKQYKKMMEAEDVITTKELNRMNDRLEGLRKGHL
jgi:hypothetical protein